MKFRVHSDLHLEAFLGLSATKAADSFVPPLPDDTETVLFLAGDISTHAAQLCAFVNICLSRFKHVVYVPGNHEFYRAAYDDQVAQIISALGGLQAKNLSFAVDEVKHTVIDDVNIIFGTMWGDGGHTLADQGAVGWFLNDFRLIRIERPNEQRKFTVSDMMKLHRRDKGIIDAHLRALQGSKTVVLTHHMPSRRLVAPRFWPTDGSDGANGGFVGDCEDILAYDHAPSVWIHGHTHDYIDTLLWKTRIVCNPTGYRGEWNTGLAGGKVETFEV